MPFSTARTCSSYCVLGNPATATVAAREGDAVTGLVLLASLSPLPSLTTVTSLTTGITLTTVTTVTTLTTLTTAIPQMNTEGVEWQHLVNEYSCLLTKCANHLGLLLPEKTPSKRQRQKVTTNL